MKRLVTGFTVILVAVVWMTGSWFFFNAIGSGAQWSGTPAVADDRDTGPKDEVAAKGQCREHCKGAHEHCRDKCKCHHRHHWRHAFLKKLNLTDAQKTQVKAIVTEERNKMKSLRQQLKPMREQIRDLVKSGPFDEAKIRAIVKGQEDTIIAIVVEKVRMKSRIYGVLTPEQRTKAEELRKKWKARHEEQPKQKD